MISTDRSRTRSKTFGGGASPPPTADANKWPGFDIRHPAPCGPPGLRSHITQQARRVALQITVRRLTSMTALNLIRMLWLATTLLGFWPLFFCSCQTLYGALLLLYFGALIPHFNSLYFCIPRSSGSRSCSVHEPFISFLFVVNHPLSIADHNCRWSGIC